MQPLTGLGGGCLAHRAVEGDYFVMLNVIKILLEEKITKHGLNNMKTGSYATSIQSRRMIKQMTMLSLLGDWET